MNPARRCRSWPDHLEQRNDDEFTSLRQAQTQGWKWKSADLCKAWALSHNAAPTRKRAAIELQIGASLFQWGLAGSLEELMGGHEVAEKVRRCREVLLTRYIGEARVGAGTTGRNLAQ